MIIALCRTRGEKMHYFDISEGEWMGTGIYTPMVQYVLVVLYLTRRNITHQQHVVCFGWRARWYLHLGLLKWFHTACERRERGQPCTPRPSVFLVGLLNAAVFSFPIPQPPPSHLVTGRLAGAATAPSKLIFSLSTVNSSHSLVKVRISTLWSENVQSKR